MQTPPQTITLPKVPRPFELHRREDISGNTGPGVVADGCLFPDGSAAMRWRPGVVGVSTWQLYDNIDALQKLHGHEGRTVVKFPDESPPLPPLSRHPRRKVSQQASLSESGTKVLPAPSAPVENTCLIQ